MTRRIEVPARVVKWLYAASGNQCAFAGCRQRLVEPIPDVDDVVVASDVAHIVAAREGGPRGQSELSAEERSRPANLILLCQKHHRLVDQDRNRYSPDALCGMKQRHAERVCAWSAPERGLLRSMPRPVYGFVGRDSELEAALSALTRPAVPGDATPRAIVITGVAGIGKTALAVQIAHLVADAFPDGQIFLSSQGGPKHTVEGIIDDLTAIVGGVPLDASVSSHQRSAYLREALVGRSLLAVVDDVPSEDVLRGLLSISESVALVCTSRSRLSGTADTGVNFIELNQLPEDDAASLATTIAGMGRLTDLAARALAAACGGHPLAIRIAASRLATRRHMDITTYLRKISDPEAGLAALFAGERTVIDVIEDSYQALEDDQAGLIRMLGNLPNVSLPLDVIAAAWTDNGRATSPRDVDPVGRLLDSLFELNLIEQPDRDSYRLHDLLHKFARGTNGAPDRSTTVRSACLAFIARLHAVNQQMCPSSDETRAAGASAAAMSLIESGRGSCIGLLEAAKDAKLWDVVAAFSSALAPVLILGGFWRDIHRVSFCLAVAGERTGSKEWLATATHNLGLSAEHLGDAESATKFYRDSESLALSSDNLVMVQAARESYGRLLFNLGRYTDALPYFKDCLRAWRTLHRDTELAQTLSTLGHLYIIVGDWRRAGRYLTNGRQVAERIRAIGLYPDFGLGLSCLYRQTGRARRAHDECMAALDSARNVADRYREALALLELGVVRQMREIPDSAAEPLQAALEIFKLMEDKVGEVKALHLLATCRRTAGDNISAARLLDRCYEMALRLGAATEAALCLADQASLLGDIGRMTDALEMLRLAEDIAADTGSRAVLARIRHCHALLLVEMGKYEAAIAILKTTGSLLRETGQSDLRASAQICMADALMNDGRPLAAAALLDPIVNAPAESIGDGTRASAYRVLATLCSRRHLWAESDRSVQRALALSRSCCDQEEEMHSLNTLGNLLARRGRPSDAVAVYGQAADIAERRRDYRFLLVTRANRLACLSNSGTEPTPPATSDRLAECDQVLELAHRLGLFEVELGLSFNKGSWLAASGQVDEAIDMFQKAHSLAASVSNAGHLATAQLHLARAHLTKGDRARSQSLAHKARKLFEARQDWINAAKALGIQIHATVTEDTLNSAISVKELIDPAWAVRGETVAALRSALKTESSPDKPDAAPSRRGRSISVADDVRNLLADAGVDTDSIVNFYAESRHACVACGLPIADDSAAELIAQPPVNDILTTRLAHTSCAPSAAVRYQQSTPLLERVNFEIECAFLGGGTAPKPAIIVDCYGGWIVGVNGKMVDVVLTALQEIGFEHVTSSHALNGDVAVTVPDESGLLSARLIGNRLTLRGGHIDSFFHDVALQFLPVWYSAAQQGVLTVMFGRNLLGMSWEDPSCLLRAGQSGRLVATVAKLTLTPPGRNALCICTPPTGLKYKRCCGRPGAN